MSGFKKLFLAVNVEPQMLVCQLKLFKLHELMNRDSLQDLLFF